MTAFVIGKGDAMPTRLSTHPEIGGGVSYNRGMSDTPENRKRALRAELRGRRRIRTATERAAAETALTQQLVHLTSDLDARFIYVFAQDVFGRVILEGSTPMCVAPGRFEIRGDHECLLRGYLEARFHEVDTRNSERWQLFLYPPPE